MEPTPAPPLPLARAPDAEAPNPTLQDRLLRTPLPRPGCRLQRNWSNIFTAVLREAPRTRVHGRLAVGLRPNPDDVPSSK
jgi:hypothetical protein